MSEERAEGGAVRCLATESGKKLLVTARSS
jgi:hypothetical protein